MLLQGVGGGGEIHEGVGYRVFMALVTGRIGNWATTEDG